MLPVVWSAVALEDVDAIADDISLDNPAAADRLTDLLFEAAAGLGERSTLYRPGREPGTREMVVTPTYLLVYRIDLNAVRILNVLQLSQAISMKLHITVPSPYARKCRIVALEKGVAVEEVAVDPYASDPRLVAANPIVQVPALETDDGVLTDSPVICEWLDVTGSGVRLLPADGPERWRVKRLETLANAGLEMGVKRVLELRRPEGERSVSWLGRWTDNLNRVLDRLEADPGIAPGLPLDLGRITAGVLVTWVGFRHPDLDWKARRPRLVALQAELEARPSFDRTRPDA